MRTLGTKLRRGGEDALKAIPDLNFWVTYSMAEGPFLGLSDPTSKAHTGRLKSPSEPTQSEFITINSVT